MTRDHTSNKIILLSNNHILIVLKIIDKINKTDYLIYSRKIWSLYNEILIYIYAEKMNTQLEKNFIASLAKKAAKIEDQKTRDEICSFIIIGMKEDSPERDLFNKAYLNERVNLEKK